MKCEHCGNRYHWKHAFSKFGYDDGNGTVETPLIANTLEDAGFTVKCAPYGPHNTIITSIRKDGWEYMPSPFLGSGSAYRIGYSDPIEYFPIEILELLEKEFPSPILFL